MRKKEELLKNRQLKEILPYAPPYLFIDRVYIKEVGKKGRGIKKLTYDDYFFEGHFPERPVMPGVIIIESIAQTAMAVMKRDDLKLKSVNKVKFRHTIQPDDIIEIQVNLEEEKKGTFKFSGQVLVDEKVAASGEVTIG
ncbi:MAG: 3-hydroxyacyl-ACP dehydratase FabZ [Elusimicrobiota bacterium]